MQLNLSQPLAHITAKFILDGQEYEIEQFMVKFSQPTDYKGQPQYEIKGGQLSLTMTQIADDNLYNWAKRSNLLKSGDILFQTDLGITILEINFIDAYCVNLAREINAFTGTTTSLVIAPKELKVNGVKHENYWPE
jgi:hypothetical protein